MDSRVVRQRAEETDRAITLWLKGQKGKATRDDALGIGQAFLSHASIAISMSIPGTEQFDADELLKGFYEALRHWTENKIKEETDGNN